jgi:RES domain-containing protein
MRGKSGLRHITSDKDASNIPLHPIGAFLPMCNYDIDMFNDFFADEIDSWMASSVACCDACYEDFCAHWPGIAFRNLDFQRSSADITWFFETSRMRDVYSPAEFSSLVHFITCPRCEEVIRHNFWIFEHRFSNVPKIERAIDELSLLGRQTPFLLLAHEFAGEVLNVIRSHAKAVQAMALPGQLFRARRVDQILGLSQNPENVLTFGPAPIQYIGEGRFNHAGNSVLYVSDMLETAKLEVGGKEEEVCVAGLAFDLPPALVLDLIDIDEESVSFDILNAIAWSALLAAPNVGSGWSKPQYVFSRFVADCARHSGFDAIRYGSTRHSSGTNYVLLNPPEDFSDRVTLVDLFNRPVLPTRS